ncbi:MAG: DUF971 domain-containing protein [Parachlamydiaceae bacterium]|nr:DUF971 domain-containing protein [Parachlamydiaceae bacterium]
MNNPFFICKIWQNDDFHFSIEWDDGMVQKFRLSELQRICSCANCKDEITGKSILNANSIHHDVRATVVRSVGRYGIQIQFTSGCSFGIYSLEELRQMK